MRLIGIVALAVAALAQEDFSGLKPDIAYLPEHVVHFNQTMKSGEFHPAAMDAAIAKEGTFLLWDVVVTPEKGAARTQLFFHHDTVLSDGDVDAATLKIWSELDGAVQMLNAHTIRQWGFKSAMFNGDTVHVQLLASTDAGVVSAAIVGALVGESDMGPEENTLCTARDRRERSRGREEFRYVAGGYCSGGLITIRGGSGLADGCLLTAGHCTGVGRVEFNVPDSSNNGQVVHPGPEHQYPVDSTSVQQANSGVGNDWKYMGAFPNSNTGLTALEAQEDSHPFQLTPTESPPQPFHHFGHGSTSPRNNLNLVNKGTPGGGTGSRTQNTMRYRFDTTGGDSGSAVTDNNGIYVAVHTHGGCSPNNPNSANIGTWIGRPQIQTAVRNPRGVCNAKILEATKTQYRYGVHFRGAVNAFEGPKITF